MKEWSKDKIGNYAKSTPGYAFDSGVFKAEGVPVIKISNIKNGYIDLDDDSTQYVEEHFLKSLDKKYEISSGDILVSLTGSHLTQPNSVVGRVGRYRRKDRALLNQRAAKIEAIKSKCNNSFLYYLLSTNTLRKEIALLAHGAANQANVSHKDIEKIKVFFPKREIQEKIAAILSSYDDLIEISNRRIVILEKMAEEIYREWFVRLRFPGHEKVKIVKGVPEGWEVKQIVQIYRTSSGGTPSREKPEYYGGNIPWVKTGELKNAFLIKTEEQITETALENSSAKIFPRHTIILAMYCAMGELSILSLDASTNQACCAFLPKYDYLSYPFSYHLIRSVRQSLLNLSFGAAQQNLSQEIIKKFKVLIPREELINKFTEVVLPVFKTIENLYIQNDRFKISRDRLLSRLMSGKIDVGNMNIQFPASMKEELVHA